MKLLALRTGFCLGLGFVAATSVARALEKRTAPDEMFAGRPMAVVAKELQSRASADPADTFLRGSTEFLASVEKLCGRFHQLGLNYRLGRELPVPFLRLQLPVCDNPKTARAEDVRAALDEFYQDLNRVEATLRPAKGKPFRLELPLGKMALDFDGNGTITEGESFLALYRQFNRRAEPDDKTTPAAAFTAVFDEADVYWIIAYTHFLRGACDLLLAHDGGDLFNAVGQMWFVRADTPLGRASTMLRDDGQRRWTGIADAIGLVHQLRLPVKDPQRLARTRTHWLSMISESRAMLASLQSETDDEKEWLPNPRQNSAFGLRLTEAQFEGWGLFLGEMEAILEGKKLLPHWRFASTHGFNVKRFLTEARGTDLVLLLQGSAAVPFIEQGECTSDDTWRRITQLFQGNFIGFAIWIN
jgi:hypothetical protein